MRPITIVVPGPIETRTGGYIYDRRMAEGLRARGRPVHVRELDDSFPFPTASALDHAAQALAAITSGDIAVIDGLAFGAMPDVIEREASRLTFVALIHLPLGADATRDAATAARLAAMERRALACAQLVVVTGKAALPLLATSAVPSHPIVVVEPGTDQAPIARGSGSDTPHVLCVATLNAGKGHDILLRALATLIHRSWQLTCAGSTSRDVATATRLRECVRKLGLSDRVTFTGDLDTTALEAVYDRSDLFVLATLRETYGMAVAEALAHGLPVVSTATGAIQELVGTEAGLVVEAGDVTALAGALESLLGDQALRAQFSEGARRVRARLPTWERAVETFASALARLGS